MILKYIKFNLIKNEKSFLKNLFQISTHRHFTTSCLKKSNLILNRKCLCFKSNANLLKTQPNLLIINSCNYLLETTTKKVLNAYDDSRVYINRLVKEKSDLVEVLNKENENLDVNRQEMFQRLNHLSNVSNLYEKINQNISELNELKAMLNNENDEMRKLINDDIMTLENNIFEYKRDIIKLLIPEEVEDKEDAVMELSAGVGGQESRIFCSELFEMYKSYASVKNWSFNPIKIYTDNTELGEMMRQAHIEISGSDVFKYLKYESGVHRVQRVPKTEAKGRIHTSTVGVVVTPKPVEIHIELNPKDLKIETKHSGGPGGQHANKTESAVRILHIPSGIVVYNDEERQMHQNKTKALSNLKQKLYQKAFEDQLNKRQANRKMQIGSSSRSERIRTYNYIQDRITDHRLDENFTGIQKFLSSESLFEMIESLRVEQQVELLNEIIENFKNKNTKK